MTSVRSRPEFQQGVELALSGSSVASAQDSSSPPCPAGVSVSPSQVTLSLY